MDWHSRATEHVRSAKLLGKDREYLDNIKFLEKDKPNTISCLCNYCVSISEISQKGRHELCLKQNRITYFEKDNNYYQRQVSQEE